MFDILLGARSAAVIPWLGLVVFTIGAVIFMRSRVWQSRPLQKCAVLSLVAHLMLVGYTMTVQVSSAGSSLTEETIEVSLVDDQQVESTTEIAAVEPEPVEPDPPEEVPTEAPPVENIIAENTEDSAAEEVSVEPGSPPQLLVVDPPLPKAEEFAAGGRPVVEEELAPLLDPSSASAVERSRQVSQAVVAPVDRPYGDGAAAEPDRELEVPDLSSRVGLPTAIPERRVDQAPTHEVPELYRMRVAVDRSKLARRFGASEATEKAVAAALKWLAENQSPDGRWKAARHGGGSERVVAGRDRRGAGSRADSAVTGLALLAFLASGHTHQKGEYRENVERGLKYLVAVQKRDGCLAGQAGTFAAMYSHAMATFAMSEAYAIGGDERLHVPLRKAIAYTLAAQDPYGGGFRYKPGDAGDTSQLGWQLMALKSAELAGMPIPPKARRGMSRYLESVSSGRHGGLASYRPGEQVSHAMTAEALVCRQFLGTGRDNPAAIEAGDYLLGNLPGMSSRLRKPNFYYWYYGTLAMHQLQGRHWQQWNAALQKALVESQRTDGETTSGDGSTHRLAGSWDPDTQWGGYGGRVYGTAMATLCLEVYYRYLPLYVETGEND